MDRILESLIAQRKLCGGGRSMKDCTRTRCRRCRRGAEYRRRQAAA